MRRENAAAERDFSHKRSGTVQTLQKASRVRQGALARLYSAGHLTIEQLASSQSIRAVAEWLGSDATIGTVSLETRVDQSRLPGGTFFEKLGAVRAEVAYGRWRKALAGESRLILAMIVDDIGPTEAGRLFRRRTATCRRVLADALDAWPEYYSEARDEIDEETLAAAHAGIVN